MTVRFTVDEDTAGEAGVRADHAVRARYPEVDRAFALRLLKDGRLRINGAQATLAARARAGSVVTIDAAANKLGPAVLPPGPACTVLWQGDGVVVVDKADGVAMHGAEGAGDSGAAEDGDGDGEDTLSALLLERFGVEDDMPGPSFPGRLDRPTSGLVVACLSRPSETALQAAWTRKDARGERDPVLKKEYLCIVHGRAPGEGDLEIPLAARRARGRGTGKVEDARTTFVTLAQSRRFSLLLCQLHTGRTHQIRRHMKAIGHPIVGDPRYGDARRDGDIRVDGAQGLMLHAWRLSHDGSVAALPATLTAPVPERFRALLRGTSLVVDDAVAAAARGERPSRAGDDDGDEAPASTSGGPAKAAPTSARPARPATERPAPTRGGPAKVAPTRGGPAKAASTRGGPAKAAPKRGGPAKAAPTRGGPGKPARRTPRAPQ